MWIAKPKPVSAKAKPTLNQIVSQIMHRAYDMISLMDASESTIAATEKPYAMRFELRVSVGVRKLELAFGSSSFNASRPHITVKATMAPTLARKRIAKDQSWHELGDALSGLIVDPTKAKYIEKRIESTDMDGWAG